MRRFSVFATVAAVTLLVAMGMGVGLGLASAEDDEWPTDADDLNSSVVLEISDENERDDVPEETRTAINNWATQNPDALEDDELEDIRDWLRSEPEGSDIEPPGNYSAEFSGSTWVTDYTLEDGTATITLVSDRDRTVTVSDALAGVDQEGAVQVPSEDYEISEGETTISMDVREVRGSSTVGVSVQGTTVRLSTEMEEPEQAEENPFRHFGGESGLFSGIIMTVGLAGLGTVHVLRSEESGVIEA